MVNCYTNASFCFEGINYLNDILISIYKPVKIYCYVQTPVNIYTRYNLFYIS